MSKNIPKKTCTSMIKKSREKLKKIIIKLKSSPPKKKLKKYVQEYGIEHTKIIGWQNRYYVFEECQLVIDHPFNPKKLKVETCNFNGWETINSITYDNQEIEHNMGDSTFKGEEFKVIKVTK